MHWKVYIELKYSEKDVESICDRLYSHHCIRSAKPSIDSGEDIKNDSEKDSSSPMNNENLIVCYASVFHSDDEEALRSYLEGLKNITIEEFKPEDTGKKISKILHISKYSAIIVFFVVFGHEVILILAKEKEVLDPWIFGLLVSLIAALVVFGVDSAMVWKEHHN